ncbi:hypothetical protein DB30_00320 [Enhygromyxa salina]|uniref:DUF5050 domain-containing protein n=1 Tax=Enhygromyxa salina TaxID=215803 RepID=A0A0C1ZQT0_9BACT|nr:hypothetical protein [Enhygromyxa salina]KIG13318.1 hypothetical protein DB30_00320 [Enhygromyxa salina]
MRCSFIVPLCLALALSSGCDKQLGSSAKDVELRDGQPVAYGKPTPLYSPKFVIRGMVADGEHLYVSGLRFAETKEGESKNPDAVPTGMIVKVPLLGMPKVIAEGAFVPMTTLRLIDDQLYWHERHDSPDGPGLRALTLDGEYLDRISDIAGHSWVIRPDVVYFTRPDDEIDEGGFYVLERGNHKPKLVARRRGVVRTLLADEASDALYWTTRARNDGTWAVYQWDGARSGKELLHSDETFASLTVDGDAFLWVTWAEDDGEPLHSLYRRPITGGETQVLARKRGLPGFMEVFADERHVYLTTVRGGELRRLAKTGGEIEVITGSGDRNVASNRFNLFWIDDKQVYWMSK